MFDDAENIVCSVLDRDEGNYKNRKLDKNFGNGIKTEQNSQLNAKCSEDFSSVYEKNL